MKDGEERERCVKEGKKNMERKRRREGERRGREDNLVPRLPYSVYVKYNESEGEPSRFSHMICILDV